MSALCKTGQDAPSVVLTIGELCRKKCFYEDDKQGQPRKHKAVDDTTDLWIHKKWKWKMTS